MTNIIEKSTKLEKVIEFHKAKADYLRARREAFGENTIDEEHEEVLLIGWLTELRARRENDGDGVYMTIYESMINSAQGDEQRIEEINADTGDLVAEIKARIDNRKNFINDIVERDKNNEKYLKAKMGE